MLNLTCSLSYLQILPKLVTYRCSDSKVNLGNSMAKNTRPSWQTPHSDGGTLGRVIAPKGLWVALGLPPSVLVGSFLLPE